MAAISWKQLYFDLYRQCNGETATTAEIMQDATARRRTIRANIARNRDAEDRAVAQAEAKRAGLEEFDEHDAGVITAYVHLEATAGEGVKVRTASGFKVTAARSMGGQLQCQLSNEAWIDCHRAYISMPHDYWLHLCATGLPASFGNDGGPDYPGRQRPRTDSEQTSAIYQYCPTCRHTVHGLFSPAGWICSECGRSIRQSREEIAAAR